MLWIDGTTDDGLLHGSAKRGPWAIFDDHKQDWLIVGLRWRWTACLMVWWLSRGNTDCTCDAGGSAGCPVHDEAAKGN